MKNLLFILFLLFQKQTLVVAQNMDSLWTIWEDSTQPDTNRLMALQIYAWDGYLYTQPDSAFYFAQLQYDLAKSKGLKRYMAGALNTQGTSLALRGDFPSALDIYFECIKIKEELRDIRGVGAVYNSIGNVYRNQSDYPKALEYYFKSLKIAEKLNDKYDIGNTLGNIGAVYADQSDFDKALEYYLMDLEISEEIGDEFGVSITLCNIGALYDNQADYEKALQYYFESLKIAEELNDLQGVGITLGNIGNVYSAQSDYPKALDYYFNSLEIYKQIGDIQGIGISLGSIGGLYTKLGRYTEAEIHLKEALAICKEIGAQNFEKDYHNFLSVLYEKTNRPALALEHYKSFVALRDTIYSEDNSKALMRSELDHEYEKAQAVANANHQKEMEKQEALAREETRRQKVVLYTVGAGFVLVVVFLFFIYRSNRQKQKANTIITLQKKEVEHQKYLIEEKHKEITDSINYAERIQRSFLATKRLLDENLKEYFVFFQPKDVVSGDFYWASKLSNGNFALVTADSTGHGVPGAIMSIANIACLKESVTKGLMEPAQILNETRKLVIEYLKNDGSAEGGKDGMDASLVCFDFAAKKLNYAAANNPVWIVRQNEVLEFAPDKMPVGKHDKQHIPFTSNEVELKTGDVVYTLTDGMPDQFGGEKGKKIHVQKIERTSNFNCIGSNVSSKEKLNKAFFDWKGDLEQVDDVCVIGVRI